MATVTGDGGVVEVGGNAVASITNFEFTRSAETVDATVMGTAAKAFKASKTEWSGTITCHWDPDDSTGQEALVIGTEVALSLQPEGDGTTGDVYYTGNAIITEEGISVPQDGMVGRTFSFQGTGALTENTTP